MKLSAALWLPVAWMSILGSRNVSSWFGMGTQDIVEGSPLDSLLFQVLIVAAGVVLARRRIQWREVFRTNRWVILYFLYLGVSVFWSDFFLVAFKRWFKDVGSLLMVMIILTEPDPRQALKTTMLRCAYLLVPFSFLFVKYFPELGRGYDQWTFEPINIGVTTDKNLLGMSLFTCALPLLWALCDNWEERSDSLQRRRLLGNSFVALMTIWLLSQAHSSTAISCTVLGSGLFLATRVSAIRRNLRHVAVFGFAASVCLILVAPMLGLDSMVVGALGRNLTLTGRTDIWKAVLAEDINPLIGTGHYSFWLGERVERISKPFFYELNEAHNGYLEVYLNVGLIGVALLLLVLLSGWRKNIREAVTGDSIAGFRLAVLLATMVYAFTEAVFRFGLLSSALLAVVMTTRPHGVLHPRKPIQFSSDMNNAFPLPQERTEVASV